MCLLSFLSLLLGPFPPPAKPWKDHLVALLALLVSEKGKCPGCDWLIPPTSTVHPPAVTIRASRNRRVRSSFYQVSGLILNVLQEFTGQSIYNSFRSSICSCLSLFVPLPGSLPQSLFRHSPLELLCGALLHSLPSPISQPHPEVVFSKLRSSIHKCPSPWISLLPFTRLLG